MNVDRLLRDVEKRLGYLDEGVRAEVLDAFREEIAKERRRHDPGLTVEAERERRVEAETLREVLEAINRQARLEDTIGEVLKQLSRVVTFDSCSLALEGGDGYFRVLAVRGFPEPSAAVGKRIQDPLGEEIRRSRFSLAIPDVAADPRFAALPGAPATRSWAGIPLLVEGEATGLLAIGRSRVEAFEEEDLHRARALAFSAAAAIRKAQLLEQVRRYAALMERVVGIDQAVFSGQSASEVAQAILDGALAIGDYRGGLLVIADGDGPRIEATTVGPLAGAWRKPAPPELDARETARLQGERAAAIAERLGLPHAERDIYLVPLATPKHHLGTLVLLDPGGDSPDDRLMESYASRAATAYLHARREGR
jgi:hypothetical protein